MGVDLVEARLRIAAVPGLADLGLADQDAIAAPRRFAVQPGWWPGRGLSSGYEPSGHRVDACGYPGYTPPPQFDPLLAKVIGTSSALGPAAADAMQTAYHGALDRTLRALDEFHIAGLPATWPSCAPSSTIQPCATVTPASTCSTKPAMPLQNAPTANGRALELLALADTAGRAESCPAVRRPPACSRENQQPICAPMDGHVIELCVARATRSTPATR
ncbi:hypothetical protein [Fodinibius sp.]|uniref:hypothetical protein n=1 Tax=Fodinibius sp. TaxID=1872440 RepID=UPI002ACD32FC|nr:hypothetical protein [Fodinibius sp.]MDZ7660083.1 hypothetical protein [Fodinibius sp.]